MREIILDIETTGLEHKEGHRVIEIGCIELNNKEVGASYHQYINPSKTLTEDNIKIHGNPNLKITKTLHIKKYLKDHRVFMMSAIAALTLNGTWIISDKDSIQTSFPNFLNILKKLGAKIN